MLAPFDQRTKAIDETWNSGGTAVYLVARGSQFTRNVGGIVRGYIQYLSVTDGDSLSPVPRDSSTRAMNDESPYIATVSILYPIMIIYYYLF